MRKTDYSDKEKGTGYFLEGYSDYWRRNKSTMEPLELTNVLRALRKVSGHIGMNVGSVEWADMSEEDPSRSIIPIDPTFVLGDYPVPPGKMDFLVGLVVHEALHQREWTQLVWKEIENMCKDVSFMDMDLLWRLVNAGEDIYVDKLADRGVFGLYTGKVRAILGARAQPDFLEPPTAGVLFDLWRRMVLDDQRPHKVNPLYKKPLKILASRTDDLVDIGTKDVSVTNRCQLRSKLYLELWEEIKDIIIPWKRERTTYFPTRAKVHRAAKSPRKRTRTPSLRSAISPQLAAQIEASLAVGSSDITPLIREICGKDNPDLVPTSLWDFNIPANPMVDPYLVGRLKGLFQQYTERIRVINRGLESGSIDRRRLYRAPITGNCFMIKQMIPEEAWNITVLVDASRSMAGPKWRLIENTVAALFQSLKGQKNKLRVFGYFEHDGVCIISELLRQGRIYSLPPHGLTPSGQAIIASALLMPKERKHRFIIHITDGESNCGCSVDYAIRFCKKEKIDLVTLGCGYKDKDILVQQYGDSLQFLDYFEQLPNAIEVLLKRKLLYSRK